MLTTLQLNEELPSAFGRGDADIKMDDASILYLQEVQVCEDLASSSPGSEKFCDAKRTGVVATIRKYSLSYILRKKYDMVVRGCKPESDAGDKSEFVEPRFNVDKSIAAQSHSVDMFLTNYSPKTIGLRIVCDGQITPTVKLTLPPN
jgi:hypothetical protein